MTTFVIESSKLEPRHKKSAPAASARTAASATPAIPRPSATASMSSASVMMAPSKPIDAQVLGPEAADRDRLVVDGICDNMSSED